METSVFNRLGQSSSDVGLCQNISPVAEGQPKRAVLPASWVPSFVASSGGSLSHEALRSMLCRELEGLGGAAG